MISTAEKGANAGEAAFSTSCAIHHASVAANALFPTNSAVLRSCPDVLHARCNHAVQLRNHSMRFASTSCP
ncbi:hypothetical protein [Streptomyces bauhiniae]|uniref:hypothetical protein n=1 Tax=Streptomyces bauhiniae TaxID=2340725 RepID=UPI00382F5C22